ncbi:Hok/Gef family protein [Salmonella enterica]|nr:Hok/Gef family protein [Salmonella enterica]ELC4946918.1 Hok/Gef family protein [Salmonella enterica]
MISVGASSKYCRRELNSRLSVWVHHILQFLFSLKIYSTGVIVSVTILALTWMTRNRICELHYSGGGVELAAFMACNPGK